MCVVSASACAVLLRGEEPFVPCSFGGAGPAVRLLLRCNKLGCPSDRGQPFKTEFPLSLLSSCRRDHERIFGIVATVTDLSHEPRVNLSRVTFLNCLLVNQYSPLHPSNSDAARRAHSLPLLRRAMALAWGQLDWAFPAWRVPAGLGPALVHEQHLAAAHRGAHAANWRSAPQDRPAAMAPAALGAGAQDHFAPDCNHPGVLPVRHKVRVCA